MLMDPELLTAIDDLEKQGLLAPEQAGRCRRVAEGRLVSVRIELRLMVGLGITLAGAGAGLFMVENKMRLGPWPPMLIIAATAATCLVWVWRRAAPFAWNEEATPTTASDYVLQFGLLSLAAALAYGEANFQLIGARWPLYLLTVGVIDLLAAYRFDSSAALSLGLSSLATWSGASLAPSAKLWNNLVLSDLRWNATILGLAFLGVGALSRRWKRKPHFAPFWNRGGLFLVAAGLLSGTFVPAGYWPWLLMLLVVGISSSIVNFLRKDQLDFVLCYLVTGTAVGRLIWMFSAEYLAMYFAMLTAIGVILLIVALKLMGSRK